MAVTGLITVNGKEVLEVNVNPSAVATPAPMGSLAMYDNGIGHLFLKIGVGDTDWSEISGSDLTHWNLAGNSLAAGDFMGSTNDQDVVFKRYNAESARMVSTLANGPAFLLGLNASLGGRLQIMAETGRDLMRLYTDTGVGTQNPIKVYRQYKCLTTDASSTTLFDIQAPANSQLLIKADVIARVEVGDVVGSGAAYIRDFRAHRLAAASIIDKIQTSFTSEDKGGYNLTIAPSGVGGIIRGSVVGDTNDTEMYWVAQVESLIVMN